MEELVKKEWLDIVETIVLALDTKGNVIFINRKGCEVLGHKEKNILGKNWFDNFIPEENKKNIVSVFKKLIKGGAGDVEYYKNPVKTKKGLKIISWHNSILKNGDGKIIGVLGAGEDVTDIVEADKEMVESEKMYKTLFQSSSDAMLTLAPPLWNFTSGNRSAIDLFGLKNEKQLFAFCPWDISPSKQPDGRLSIEKAKEEIEKAMREGSNSFEWVHKKSNGETFPCLVSLSKIKFKGEYILQTTIRDISKQKEDAREAEKFNQFAVNRELKMIELKNEINSLLKELGRAPRYKNKEDVV